MTKANLKMRYYEGEASCPKGVNQAFWETEKYVFEHFDEFGEAWSKKYNEACKNNIFANEMTGDCPNIFYFIGMAEDISDDERFTAFVVRGCDDFSSASVYDEYFPGRWCFIKTALGIEFKFIKPLDEYEYGERAFLFDYKRISSAYKDLMCAEAFVLERLPTVSEIHEIVSAYKGAIPSGMSETEKRTALLCANARQENVEEFLKLYATEKGLGRKIKGLKKHFGYPY